jgi:hypothetical protein
LLIYLVTIVVVGLLSVAFSMLFLWMDDVYVQNWCITFAITLCFDQLVTESIVLTARLLYRRSRKNVKLTSKYG